MENEEVIQNKLDNHEQRIQTLEKSDVKFETILQQTISSNEKLLAFMDETTSTLVRIQENLKHDESDISDLKTNQKSENDRGKLDITNWLSQNWFTIVLSLAVAFDIIKNYIK
jgi:DNA-binding protein H-NS